MSIKFLCPHCKKVLSVKDEFAGKRGKCTHCQKIITVPVPAKPSSAVAQAAPKPAASAPPPQAAPKPAAPPPKPTNIEDEAAAALIDEPKDEAPPEPTTIDFTCPMCDAELHLPLSEASKRIPCPECKRIIKVPEPAKRDPTNWRQTAPNLPSGAKRAEEKAPEGAWGSATGAATVSRESLQEAGAVPSAKQPVPLSRRITWWTAVGGGAVLLAVASVFGYLKWLDTREEQGVQAALNYAESEKGKAELGADGRAALYCLAGEYFLRNRQADSAKTANDCFLKSLSAVGEGTGAASEHDALLQDLALAEVELGGTQADVDAGLREPWDKVQKELQAALGKISNPEARLEAMREVGRRMAVQGEGARATALTNALYPTPNEEKAEAVGAVGLEFSAAGKKDLAEKAAEQVKTLYGEKDRPALAPAAVALALVLGRDLPEPSKKPSKWVGEDAINDALGRVEGQARSGQWEETRRAAQGMAADLQLRAYAALAEAALDDKKAGAADIAEALKRAQPSSSSWLLLRLIRIGARAGVAPDTLQPVAAMISDRDLRGRAQLAVLQAQLEQSKQAVDVKAVDAVEAQTLSARLAREAWARRYGSAGVVRGWDPPNRAFGQVGVALGPQGDD